MIMDITLPDDIKDVIFQYLQEQTKTLFRKKVLKELKTNTKYIDNLILNSEILLQEPEPTHMMLTNIDNIKRLCSGSPIFARNIII